MENQLPAFLDVVVKETQSDKCFIVHGDNFCLNNQGDSYRRSIAEYLAQLPDDPFYNEVILNPLGSAIQLSGKTKKLIDKSKFRKLYTESNTSEVLATVGFLDGVFLALSLNRAPGQKCFDENHGYFLSLLMPHLIQAFALQDALQPKAYDNPKLQVAVELCAKPAAILNIKSNIVYMNYNFEKWALRQPLLCVSNRSVRFKLHKLDALFRMYLHMKCLGSSRYLSIKVASSILRFLPVPSALLPNAALLTVDCPHPPDISWAKIHFDLTAKEYQVLMGMVQGHSLHDISDSLFISYHTVRSHVKSLFYKTNTHSQPELLALLFMCDS